MADSRRLRWLVPGLLTTVAIAQGVAAKRWELNSWIGGGFGMFATGDQPSHRLVRVEAETADGHRCIIPREHLRAFDVNMRAAAMLPTQRPLGYLGRRLLALHYRAAQPDERRFAGTSEQLKDRIADRPARLDPECIPAPPIEGTTFQLAKVSISVWRMGFADHPSGPGLAWQRIGESVMVDR